MRDVQAEIAKTGIAKLRKNKEQGVRLPWHRRSLQRAVRNHGEGVPDRHVPRVVDRSAS
jgi:hypothetical protein